MFLLLTYIVELFHHEVSQYHRHELERDIHYHDAAGGNPEVHHRGTLRHSRSKDREP